MQNSVDSIRRWNNQYGESKTREHSISITIDKQSRKITVVDTGTGFDPDNVPDLLAPHGTDKEDLADEVGEKGVGLTYTMFSSNKFSLISKSVKGTTEAVYEGGLSWLKISSKETQPKLEFNPCLEEFDPLETFSEISLEDVSNLDDDLELFDWNIDQFTHILRTKTAIGNLKKIFGTEGLNIEVNLSVKEKTGESESRKIPFKYQAPVEFYKEDDIFDVTKDAHKILTVTDVEKRKKLSGKVLVCNGQYKSVSRELNYVAYFVPGGNIPWNKIQSDISDTDSESSFNYIARPGIYVFIKGMPTGITVTAPNSGSAGYWSSMFVLINADYLEFDLGRKSINGKTVDLFKKAAAEAFNTLEGLFPYVSSERHGPSIPSGMGKKKKNHLERLNNLPDLGVDGISYLKTPSNQEAAVAAIFHEMLGAGIIKGYCGLGWSYHAQYDMYAKYRGLIDDIVGKKVRNKALDENENDPFLDDDITIEFKYKAESVIYDVKERVKEFQDIKVIICWDIDEEKFTEYNIQVLPLTPDDSYFHSANYQIIFPNYYNLGEDSSSKYVIALRKIVDDIRRDPSNQ